jgi:hypothetical protein
MTSVRAHKKRWGQGRTRDRSNWTKKSYAYTYTPEQRRRWHLKAKYGLTLEEYETMRVEQDGKCAICESGTLQLVVDHCHKTGRVRGLLCVSCNASLGLLRDDPEVILRAAQYLNARKE